MVDLSKARISGTPLKAVASMMRRPSFARLVTKRLRGQLGIDALRALPDAARTNLPFNPRPTLARPSHDRSSQDLDPPARSGWPRDSGQYRGAFAGGLSPVELTERAIVAARTLARHQPHLGPMVEIADADAMKAAKASAERHRRGQTLGPLDGIPVVIKEELDVAGLPTRMGTGWMSGDAAPRDATVTARLRAAGAIILGNTVMTEYGLSPLGGNAHRRMPGNIHRPEYLPGGSSSGSGVAVAAGVCPIALGTDAGGSVRVPAAWNGVFGLKPTFARIPMTGDGLPGGCSTNHIGPLASTPTDLALAIEIGAGACGGDPFSAFQPALAPGYLTSALRRGVEGLKIGIIESEWADAPEELTKPAREALDALVADGAELVPVALPLAGSAPAVGFVTVGVEMLTVLRRILADHLEGLGSDVRILLEAVSSFEPDDYLDTQRVRGRLKQDVAAALKQVDVLALPMTACTPPRISDHQARTGFLDPDALAGTTRFAFLANTCGLPAGTAPVGWSDGLPIGLQIVGDAWDEACVLQVLAHLERAGIARVEPPAAGIDLLEG